MLETPPKVIKMEIPPWPDFLMSNYRYFEYNEKHVTRICKDFVLIFMLENSLFFTENSHDVEVKAGQWYIQAPGLKQEGGKGSPAPVYYYIHFQAVNCTCDNIGSASAKENSESMPNTRYLYLPVRGNFDIHYLRPLFEQLESLSKHQHSDILGLETVFLTILNSLVSKIHPHMSASQELVLQVMEYLGQNFSKPVTCEDISRKFHFSSDYLTRKMRQHFGITPWQYIQQLRVGRAKELLANTDYTLSLIAAEVGYNDLSVFYKAFRKQTGDAPGIWRCRVRGLDTAEGIRNNI